MWNRTVEVEIVRRSAICPYVRPSAASSSTRSCCGVIGRSPPEPFACRFLTTAEVPPVKPRLAPSPSAASSRRSSSTPDALVTNADAPAAIDCRTISSLRYVVSTITWVDG